MTPASTRSSTSSTSARLSALAPGYLLLRSVATLPIAVAVLAPLALAVAVAVLAAFALALAVAVLAPLALAVAVAVFAPIALALAVAILAGERARQLHARRVGLGLLGLSATMILC